METYTVLTKGRNVSVVTGNNCLKVFITREDYERELSDYSKAIVPYIKERVDYFFEYNDREYGLKGTYNWDVTAAVYLMRPDVFEDEIYKMNLSVEDLKTGFLRCVEDGNTTINLPIINNEELYNKNIYDTWKQVEI